METFICEDENVDFFEIENVDFFEIEKLQEIEDYLENKNKNKIKKYRKSNIFTPIPGKHFNYSEGVIKIVNENNYIPAEQIYKIGKDLGMWDHKLKTTSTGKNQIRKSTLLTLYKLVKRNKIKKTKNKPYLYYI